MPYRAAPIGGPQPAAPRTKLGQVVRGFQVASLIAAGMMHIARLIINWIMAGAK